MKIFILTKKWFYGLHALMVANSALKYEMNSAQMERLSLHNALN